MRTALLAAAIFWFFHSAPPKVLTLCPLKNSHAREAPMMPPSKDAVEPQHYAGEAAEERGNGQQLRRRKSGHGGGDS